jgi:pimeloyl-ACP methyl ester carboxylesterase
MKNIIFIHGLESSGKGFKGQYLKKVIPEILTPDFVSFNSCKMLGALLNARMAQLNAILSQRDVWVIIGSSFGGLMGVLFALQNQKKVERLILLAPYLATKLLEWDDCSPINIPVIIYHGKNDDIAKFEASRERAYRLFTKLEFNATEDDHNLNQTVEKLNWIDLIS